MGECGIGRVHRYPLAELKCMSQRVRESDLSLGLRRPLGITYFVTNDPRVVSNVFILYGWHDADLDQCQTMSCRY